MRTVPHASLFALLAALVVVPAPATAQYRFDAGPDTMRAGLRAYFDGEARGGLWFAGAGVAGVAAGGVLLAQEDSERAMGAGYPVLIAGALQLTVGAMLSLRTADQVAALEAQLAADAPAFAETELRRVRGVVRTFGLLEAIEVTLIGVGGAMVLAGELDGRPIVAGIGAGLAAQAAVTLVLDIFADRRAATYLEDLQRFRAGLALSDRGAMVTATATF